MAKERPENSFRNTKSKDGTLSVNLSKETAGRVTYYCKRNNLNRKKFVEQCVNDAMDVIKEQEARQELLGKSKEELIDMILGK